MKRELIRILLVDDHNLVRAGLRALLERIPGVTVVAEAGNGRDAVQHVKATKFDIVLMDISMPDMSGIEATDQISRKCPETKIIVLTMHRNQEHVVEAIRRGAVGYLLKNAAPDELTTALEAVVSGKTYISPSIADQLAEYVRRSGIKDSELPLTSRQREVLQLIAEGRSTKEIAAVLNISVKTVDMHRSETMRRLKIREVAGLVRYALRVGLVAPGA